MAILMLIFVLVAWLSGLALGCIIVYTRDTKKCWDRIYSECEADQSVDDFI